MLPLGDALSTCRLLAPQPQRVEGLLLVGVKSGGAGSGLFSQARFVVLCRSLQSSHDGSGGEGQEF